MGLAPIELLTKTCSITVTFSEHMSGAFLLKSKLQASQKFKNRIDVLKCFGLLASLISVRHDAY